MGISSSMGGGKKKGGGSTVGDKMERKRRAEQQQAPAAACKLPLVQGAAPPQMQVVVERERWLVAFLSVYAQVLPNGRLHTFRRPEAEGGGAHVVRSRDAMLKLLPEFERTVVTFYASEAEALRVSSRTCAVNANDAVYLHLEQSADAPAGWYRALVLLHSTQRGFVDGAGNSVAAGDGMFRVMGNATNTNTSSFGNFAGPSGKRAFAANRNEEEEAPLGVVPQLSHEDVMRCLLSERQALGGDASTTTTTTAILGWEGGGGAAASEDGGFDVIGMDDASETAILDSIFDGCEEDMFATSLLLSPPAAAPASAATTTEAASPLSASSPTAAPVVTVRRQLAAAAAGGVDDHFIILDFELDGE